MADNDPVTTRRSELLVGRAGTARLEQGRATNVSDQVLTASGRVGAHGSVGIMTLNYEVLQLPDDPGRSLIRYSADTGSPFGARLRELVGG